ncbi:unnamed protein product [Durusdinium trenchii]|uniref:Mitotic checkpoint protein BUB3.2 n=2 Tax=Durusdinium trenchii TaxID=1381693 RepID=A0ABP0MTW9_9DINO
MLSMVEHVDADISDERPEGHKHGCHSDRADRAIVKHRREMAKAVGNVKQFLMKNHFSADPNGHKGKLFVTYPLHEAVKQNNPYITWALLIFGADARTKDSWGRTAYEYGGRASQEKVREVFQKLGVSPTSPVWSGTSNLTRFPPPRGWERFFARLAKDPLVQAPNCEDQWLQELGEKTLKC